MESFRLAARHVEEPLDDLVRRVGEEFGGATYLEDSSAVHHRDTIRKQQRFGDIVGDQDDRQSELVPHRNKLLLQAVARDGIDRAKWLVHQKDFGFGSERTRYADPLLLSAREFRGPSFSIGVGFQADPVQEFVHAAVNPIFGPAE
jgi:hypothetical protein